MDNFILIPNLGIGGSIILDYKTSFLLDIGYKVLKFGNSTTFKRKEFDEKSKHYVETTKSNTQRDLGEGRFTKKIMEDQEVVSHLAASLCKSNDEIRQLQRWILNAFPDVASSYLLPGGNNLIESVGSAFLIHKCQEIRDYKVFWNYSLGDTCYKTFPVISKDLPKPYFLNLKEKRLYSVSQKIQCNKRGYPTYVSDIMGYLWKLDKSEQFKKLRYSQYTTRFSPDTLPEMENFKESLLHYDVKPPDRITLLEILAENKDILDSLNSYKEEGDGDLISGIGKVLGRTISSITTGSSKIIKSLAKSMKDAFSGISDLDTEMVDSISNATSSMITTSTTGAAKVINSLGGIGSIILWILVLTLYAIMFYTHWPRNLVQRYRNRDSRPKSFLLREPSLHRPIPPPRNSSRKTNQTLINPPPSPNVPLSNSDF